MKFANSRVAVAALVTAVGVLFLAGPSTQAGTSVVGSKHDLRAANGGPAVGLIEVCVTCHTPHQATAANRQYPLWNHTGTTTAAYGVYTSVTMNVTPTEIGPGGTLGTQSVSMLCMSCHDGTVAVANMLNPPNSGFTGYAAAGNVTAAGLITGTPNIGTDLRDDHPVNFLYATSQAADAGLRVGTDPLVVPLLVGGMVQCSSCHDVHNPQYVPFLVKDNTASAICTSCHIK